MSGHSQGLEKGSPTLARFVVEASLIPLGFVLLDVRWIFFPISLSSDSTDICRGWLTSTVIFPEVTVIIFY